MFEVTSAWKSAFPEAHAGVLVMCDVVNPAHHPELEKHKTELEEHPRSQFSSQDRAAMTNHPVLQAYNTYYRRFKKSIMFSFNSNRLSGRESPFPAWLIMVKPF